MDDFSEVAAFFHQAVCIEFPDMQAARAFVDSEEYAPVKPLRLENVRCTLVILDGL